MTTDRTDTTAVEALADQYADTSADIRGRKTWSFDNHGLAAFSSRLTAPQPGAAVPGEIIESAAKYGWEHASWDWENVRLGLGRFAAAPAPEVKQPDGYAYRYEVGHDMTVIRMNGGREVNGAMPIEAVPYYFGKPAPDSAPASPAPAVGGEAVAYLRVDPAEIEPTVPVLPEHFAEWFALGYEMRPLGVIANPAPAAAETEGVEFPDAPPCPVWLNEASKAWGLGWEACRKVALHRLANAPQQCCMCGKRFDAREQPDGGGEGAELTDGRWTCSADCWERATNT